MKHEIINYLESNYSESTIANSIDEVIPNYLDADWSDEFDEPYEAYLETGRGEAEDEISMVIQKEIQDKFKMSYEEVSKEIGMELYELIQETFPILNS